MGSRWWALPDGLGLFVFELTFAIQNQLDECLSGMLKCHGNAYELSQVDVLRLPALDVVDNAEWEARGVAQLRSGKPFCFPQPAGNNAQCTRPFWVRSNVLGFLCHRVHFFPGQAFSRRSLRRASANCFLTSASQDSRAGLLSCSLVFLCMRQRQLSPPKGCDVSVRLFVESDSERNSKPKLRNIRPQRFSDKSQQTGEERRSESMWLFSQVARRKKHHGFDGDGAAK